MGGNHREKGSFQHSHSNAAGSLADMVSIASAEGYTKTDLAPFKSSLSNAHFTAMQSLEKTCRNSIFK